MPQNKLSQTSDVCRSQLNAKPVQKERESEFVAKQDGGEALLSSQFEAVQS